MITQYIKSFCFATLTCLGMGAALGQDQYNNVKAIDSLNSDAEESLPLYNDVNHTLYTVRTFHKDNTGGKNSGNEIWAYDRTEGKKFVPSTHDISLLNNEFSNAVVGIADHGHKLYLLNHYNPEDSAKAGLSYSRWDIQKQGWDQPKIVPINGLKENTKIYNIYVNRTDDKMFLSMSTKEGADTSFNIYGTTKAGGVWSEPKLLGATINKNNSDEITPYLSNDGRFLFFASNKNGGKGGFDIYKSEMKGSDITSWSEPKNIKALNSDKFDAYYSEGADHEIYFSSNRGGSMANLYQADHQEKKKETVETKKVVSSGVLSSHPYVNFAFDVYKLNKSARNYLAEVVDSMVQNPSWHVDLDGHTDSIGTNAYNRDLARKRAISAEKYLLDHGISQNRILIRYYGEKKPVRTNETEFGRYMNRRVEITFLKDKAAKRVARKSIRKFKQYDPS